MFTTIYLVFTLYFIRYYNEVIYSIREDVGRLYAGNMQTLCHIEHLWILMSEGIAGTNNCGS